jgi:hypothetical protein
MWPENWEKIEELEPRVHLKMLIASYFLINFIDRCIVCISFKSVDKCLVVEVSSRCFAWSFLKHLKPQYIRRN